MHHLRFPRLLEKTLIFFPQKFAYRKRDLLRWPGFGNHLSGFISKISSFQLVSDGFALVSDGFSSFRVVSGRFK